MSLLSMQDHCTHSYISIFLSLQCPAYLVLGRIHFMGEHWESAAQELSTAIKLQPNFGQGELDLKPNLFYLTGCTFEGRNATALQVPYAVIQNLAICTHIYIGICALCTHI